MLSHPGATRTEATACQHFDCKGACTMAITTCKKCQLCQKVKVTNQKCCKLPAKQAQNPWDKLCFHLISPCKIQRKDKHNLKPWCLVTVIHLLASNRLIRNAAKAADICETAWFTQHWLPQPITLDQGAEFQCLSMTILS
jgi:hypothetical protein